MILKDGKIKKGSISTALRIACRVNWEGKLITTVRNPNGEVVFEFVTER